MNQSLIKVSNPFDENMNKTVIFYDENLDYLESFREKLFEYDDLANFIFLSDKTDFETTIDSIKSPVVFMSGDESYIIKTSKKYESVRFVYVTDDIENCDHLFHCISGIIEKDIQSKKLINFIRRLLIEYRNNICHMDSKGALKVLSFISHIHDLNLATHTYRVSRYSYYLAKLLGLDDYECQNIKIGSAYHDLGKMMIDPNILDKPSKLTEEEFNVIKSHPEIGGNILRVGNSPLFYVAANIAECHHENWDGSGYPKGLSGEEIPLEARIVSITDVFDSLTTTRAYKKPWTLEDAKNFIVKHSGNKFDPNIVKIFVDNFEGIKAIHNMEIGVEFNHFDMKIRTTKEA